MCNCGVPAYNRVAARREQRLAAKKGKALKAAPAPASLSPDEADAQVVAQPAPKMIQKGPGLFRRVG